MAVVVGPGGWRSSKLGWAEFGCHAATHHQPPLPPPRARLRNPAPTRNAGVQVPEAAGRPPEFRAVGVQAALLIGWDEARQAQAENRCGPWNCLGPGPLWASRRHSSLSNTRRRGLGVGG